MIEYKNVIYRKEIDILRVLFRHCGYTLEEDFFLLSSYWIIYLIEFKPVLEKLIQVSHYKKYHKKKFVPPMLMK